MWKNHSLVLIVALILAACGTGTSQAPDRPFERARGPGGEQLAMTGETRPESSPEAEGFSDETASDGRLSLDSSEETAEYGGDMPMEEPQLMPSPAPMRSSASGTAMGRGALEMPAGGEGEAASDEARASSAPPRA
ncbi:MAG: hypothetical protein OEY14_11780, partial [Myxococcales bacterium]|nr:hypothetical protein [Myxococcales bacterium]